MITGIHHKDGMHDKSLESGKKLATYRIEEYGTKLSGNFGCTGIIRGLSFENVTSNIKNLKERFSIRIYDEANNVLIEPKCFLFD